MRRQADPSVAASVQALPALPRYGRRGWASRILGRRDVIMLLINIAFMLGIAGFTPYFLTPSNFNVMLVGMAMETIVLAAMVILLVGGMFDLSVDGVVNMSGVLTGALLTRGVDMWLSIPAGVAAALVIGLINGISVTKMRMNPLMTTLGTWWIAQGIAYGITQGISSHTFSSKFIALGMANPLSLTMPLWYMLVLVPLAIWVLAKTRFGYHVYATGGNREGARLHGVKVDRITIVSFVLVALASALAGIIYAARLNAAVPQAVNGLNLRVIAGAVIGGCSLAGGEGNLIGALLGLLFMTMLVNASIILAISPYWQISVLGVVVVVAVAADALAKRKVSSA
jgi:ribose/xylose/arabinose/galactoside ABC-type transport system permease subunit